VGSERTVRSVATVFSVRRTDEPETMAHCYEVDSPDWRQAVAAFLLDRGIAIPASLEVRRWDGSSWQFVVRAITKWEPVDASSRARRVQCPR
jgi:hypothetical protein